MISMKGNAQTGYQTRDLWRTIYAVLYGLGVPGLVAQSVAHLTQEPRVPGSIPGSATYFRFSFGRFKKGSCLLLAKVCARSTG